ncbi:cobalt-precorrin-6A reductase [Chachezhania antarctica]|uniref:cobalt-precorrin-6A reductase n=1 Tax=Chachezhania antarctica TaxID=2340860 RepID=UPI000EAD9184|nr:cobalt-precorrin-6A reductase [Chachezhania antarctica]|tara:strand:- start:1312 stop:2067 length:756 start_codon:yes stop_codon:yes gene_type:complete
MEPYLLILGGTAEASALAAQVSQWGVRAVYSYAGRVAAPKEQPIPTRIGGFGGAEGLAEYIRSEGITHMVDATHPFAAAMSSNAVKACAMTRTALIALSRPAWVAQPGDNWQSVRGVGRAMAALGETPRRVFLATGRQNLEVFAKAPQHFYLLRLVDQPDGPLPLPNVHAEIATGPFNVASDRALLEEHKIDVVVSKNAGGTGARAKLDAARALGLPVIMIERPEMPERHEVHDLDAIYTWLAHAGTDLGV